MWLTWWAPANGIATFSTLGSDFDTVLAVYTGPGTDFASLIPVACDNDSGADGRDSKVLFQAVGGALYFIAVDGVGGASGTVKLNYLLGDPPIITTNPASCVVPQGGAGKLQVSATAVPTATYQWFFEHACLPGATNATLTVSNFNGAKVGRYKVKVKNVLGAACSAPAEVLLQGPLTLQNHGRATQGGFHLQVLGGLNTTYVIEASTNLQVWLPLAPNFTPTGLLDFTDPAATNFPHRYYRVRSQ